VLVANHFFPKYAALFKLTRTQHSVIPQVHPKDGDYYYKAAQTIEPLARHYLPEYYAFVIKNYSLADQFSKRADTKTQSRLFIACIYRDQKKPQQAIAWYGRVLEVDRQNRDALRNLKELGTSAK
jgi:hypothetical protein